MKKIFIITLIILFTSIFLNIYLFNKVAKSNDHQITENVNTPSISELSEKNGEINNLSNETINVSKEDNKSNENLQKELDEAKETIKKLSTKIIELENAIRSFKTFYENDMRDNFIIVDDSKIISFQKTPYEIIKEFDCKIQKESMDDRDYITLILDGLTIEYLYVEDDNSVESFVIGYEITSSRYKTEKCITIGNTYSDIMSTYKYIYSEDDNSLITYFNNSERGHTIMFDENKVITKITFGTLNYR